jgi:hypothetical protein
MREAVIAQQPRSSNSDVSIAASIAGFEAPCSRGRAAVLVAA